ncbi:MAG: GNAT family N-acetyltransferase [Nanoarchaeota archaeon]|nr:GNAT family N-acetyltransferase [Nanoarchaeota archaeon]
MEMCRFDEDRHLSREFIEMCNASIGINYSQIDDSFGRGMIEANKFGEPYGLYSRDFELWVGEDGSQMQGFVSLVKKRGGSSKIKALIVNPSARGMGIGSQLYEFAMRQLEIIGARKVYGTDAFIDYPTIKYDLLKGGFEVEGSLREPYKEGVSEIIIGRMFQRGIPIQTIAPPRKPKSERLDVKVSEFQEEDSSGVRQIVLNMMPTFYGDINDDFVNRMAYAHERYAKQGLEYSAKPRIMHIAKVDEQIAGVGLFAPKRGGSAKLSPFLVAPQFQSMGVGSALIEDIEAHARKLNVRRLYHHFPSCLIMSQLFFAKHGYLPEARIREPYSSGVDEIVASKFLK